MFLLVIVDFSTSFLVGSFLKIYFKIDGYAKHFESGNRGKTGFGTPKCWHVLPVESGQGQLQSQPALVT